MLPSTLLPCACTLYYVCIYVCVSMQHVHMAQLTHTVCPAAPPHLISFKLSDVEHVAGYAGDWAGQTPTHSPGQLLMAVHWEWPCNEKHSSSSDCETAGTVTCTVEPPLQQTV